MKSRKIRNKKKAKNKSRDAYFSYCRKRALSEFNSLLLKHYL